MSKSIRFPVVDLFAGPGGLGEGFASLRRKNGKGQYKFRTAISIERDPHAHKTLQLRHFFRAFPPDKVPDDYYMYLHGEISREALFEAHPREADEARRTAWQCTLGEEPAEVVKHRINSALGNENRWALVGGPPCQAYSLVGRSRMMGSPEFASDPRHFLYKEYLRVLADHAPPVFVMENVKGLLSAKVNDELVLRKILTDLSNPGEALKTGHAKFSYRLYSLSHSGLQTVDSDPRAFIVRAEDYGIPQARHRIFILGIREDVNVVPVLLPRCDSPTTVRDVIGTMPRLRSGISKASDTFEQWLEIISETMKQPWLTHGRENGHAALFDLALTSLDEARSSELSRADSTYSYPLKLAEWISDDRVQSLSSHETRSHIPGDLHRYFFASLFAAGRQISPKLSDFPFELLPDHRNVSAGTGEKMFSDRFRVQLPDSPSTTITSHIAKDGHYFIHYDPVQCRSLTVREAARLQTFPDNYKFEGPRTEQYHQVGNAVPPLLASMIAEVVSDVLERMQ